MIDDKAFVDQCSSHNVRGAGLQPHGHGSYFEAPRSPEPDGILTAACSVQPAQQMLQVIAVDTLFSEVCQ